MKLAFSPVTDQSRGMLRAALEAARQPTDDLDEPGRRFFELSDDQGPIGFVGIEGDGTHRLVRSLVVLPAGSGQGTAGCWWPMSKRSPGARARSACISSPPPSPTSSAAVVIAPPIERTPPGVIAATAQFASLCPDIATYLVKDLA